MAVTAIEQMTKTKLKVYIDESFAFVLTKAEAQAYGLREGASIDDSIYTKIMDEVIVKKAIFKAMNLLKARDYTQAQLCMKLKSDFYPPKAIDSAIDYVRSYHYIDDRRYAENFCLRNAGTMSRQMMTYKLIQKGVPKELIEDCLNHAETDEKKQIISLFRQKFCTSDMEDVKKRQKILNFFLRKGYTYHDITAALKDIDAQNN